MTLTGQGHGVAREGVVLPGYRRLLELWMRTGVLGHMRGNRAEEVRYQLEMVADRSTEGAICGHDDCMQLMPVSYVINVHLIPTHSFVLVKDSEKTPLDPSLAGLYHGVLDSGRPSLFLDGNKPSSSRLPPD
jgi:hypothetical protein